MASAEHARFDTVAIVIGPAAAVAAGGLLENVRDDVGATNIALILATIVVLAAIAGRTAGVVTALFAAASFNFFHTQPYHSLRIHDAQDVVTVVLLVVIGLVTSALGNWRREVGATARRRLHGERSLVIVAERLAAGDSPDDLWPLIRDDLVRELRLGDCRYEPRPTTVLPAVGRTGSLPSTALRLGPDGFDLPPAGVVIDVSGRGRSFGQIVLVPAEHSPSQREQRRIAVALADLFAVALDRANPSDSAPTSRTSAAGDTTT